METQTVSAGLSLEQLGLPIDYLEPRGYAAYTSVNHEKRVAEHLGVREVEHFLSLYASVRRWKNRRARLQMPLFPGYVFVRLALRDRLQVLCVPGVVRLVGFNGTATALPDKDIAALRTSLACGVRAEPHPYLNSGAASAREKQAASGDARDPGAAEGEVSRRDLNRPDPAIDSGGHRNRRARTGRPDN